jgi:hypothetical protein
MEINGLKVIVDAAVDRGTIHGIRSPPAREKFASDDEYRAAYDEWWDTVHLWSCTVINVGE